MDIDLESKLIEAVRERPALYDKRLEGYHKSKDTLWEQIASLQDHEGLQGSYWSKQWTKLRNQYMAHRRRLRKPSGSASARRPFFRHEQAMKFIGDTLGEEETYSNVNEQANGNVIESDHNGITDETVGSNENQDGMDDVEVQSTTNKDHRSHTKFNSKRKLDSFDESLLELLKSDNKDEYATFGDLIAHKLRKVAEKDLRSAAELQHTISNAIHDTEMYLLRNVAQ